VATRRRRRTLTEDGSGAYRVIVGVAVASTLVAAFAGIAGNAGVSVLVAFLGLPVAALGALVGPTRAWIVLALAALAANAVVMVLWAREIYQALENAR
jgi:hypothetical protein